MMQPCFAHRALARQGSEGEWLQTLPGTSTSQTAVLVDTQGRRCIYCDLKDLQQQALAMDRCRDTVGHVRAAVVGNINLAQPMLQASLEAAVLVVIDVHDLHDFEDDYNCAFIRAASVIAPEGHRDPAAAHEPAMPRDRPGR
jgi:ribokinase